MINIKKSKARFTLYITSLILLTILAILLLILIINSKIVDKNVAVGILIVGYLFAVFLIIIELIKYMLLPCVRIRINDNGLTLFLKRTQTIEINESDIVRVSRYENQITKLFKFNYLVIITKDNGFKLNDLKLNKQDYDSYLKRFNKDDF